MSPDDHGFTFHSSARDLLTHAARLTSAARITLWVGTGLSEQLLVIWLVELCRLLGVDRGALRVVQFDSVGRGFEVVGTGALHPEQWRSGPVPAPLDAGMLEEASRGWAAVTAPTPDALLRYLAETGHALPHLPRALRAGDDLLAGRGHFVAWNGIDDHVAGVHLRSAVDDVWYRSGETLSRSR